MRVYVKLYQDISSRRFYPFLFHEGKTIKDEYNRELIEYHPQGPHVDGFKTYEDAMNYIHNILPSELSAYHLVNVNNVYYYEVWDGNPSSIMSFTEFKRQ